MSNGSGDFEDYEFENNLYANEIGLKEHETIVDNFLPKIVYNPRSNDLYTKFASHKKVCNGCNELRTLKAKMFPSHLQMLSGSKPTSPRLNSTTRMVIPRSRFLPI